MVTGLLEKFDDWLIRESFYVNFFVIIRCVHLYFYFSRISRLLMIIKFGSNVDKK